ncbi:hypothetical protein [Nocardiopsis aegyptia]|uniref:Uncharacterized protein n=1 Tax=Nocardiopsis aegyptia TaxID=220378 RepID=A0A7Z0EIW3_9ACTN|nr:hypothetical protein [Nocardiopsis aegyptia]NYJ32831.1 hypothetical protein [Nocardiopsis aegyptia]
MGNDSNFGKRATAAIGVIASVLGILTFFGISNWNTLTSKLSGSAQPSGTELFPVSFTHQGWTLTATSRPDTWDECEEDWGCIANIKAQYTAEDPGLIVMVSVSVYSDSEAATRHVEEQRQWEQSNDVGGYGYSAVSGSYSVTAGAIDFQTNDPYTASSTIGRQVLSRLPLE